MNFFVSENIYSYNSGTELSQVKRVQAFETAGYDAKYVTRNYNRFLYRDREDVGLRDDQVINMYDYFQGVMTEPRTEQNLRMLNQIPLDEYKVEAHGPNYSTIDYQGRTLAKIDVMPATVGLVNTITYYDRFNNPTVRENFDWRGFKSSIDYFHPGGELATQKFLDITGKVVLEVVHMNVNGKIQPTMYKLIDFNGKNYRFNFEDQMFLFFLNEITGNEDGGIIISDRRNLDYVVADISSNCSKWAYFHDSHTPKPVGNKTELFAAYRPALEQRASDFDGIMVPTKEQKTDILARYPDLNVVVVPDTFVETNVVITQVERNKNKIIFVGRLSPEKRPEDAIRIFAKIAKVNTEAKLEFDGYPANPEYLQTLNEMVEKEGLQDKITFNDFKKGDELVNAYQSASVLIQTSQHEGLGMNMVEAMGYGLPVVSYSIKYGPKELIENGVDGYLIDNNNVTEFAQRVNDVLQNQTLWDELHAGALDEAEKYSKAEVSHQWDSLMSNLLVSVS